MALHRMERASAQDRNIGAAAVIAFKAHTMGIDGAARRQIHIVKVVQCVLVIDFLERDHIRLRRCDQAGGELSIRNIQGRADWASLTRLVIIVASAIETKFGAETPQPQILNIECRDAHRMIFRRCSQPEWVNVGRAFRRRAGQWRHRAGLLEPHQRVELL